MSLADLVGDARPLTSADVEAAAKVLQVGAARIRAVISVESRGRGFHPESRRPIILFEPHIFARLTGGRFNAAYPDLSYPNWGERDYPPTQAQRYDQVNRARAIAPRAALESTSWGLFQIMGFNAPLAGFPDVQAFVAAMLESEGLQLAAFARLAGSLARDGRSAADCLRAGDWAGFARIYNGAAFARHGYDQKLKAAYAAEFARKA